MTCKFANKTIRSSIKQPEALKMESSFWKEVWNEGQIGFHQSEINKNLKRFAQKFKDRSTVLVPLCGKSKDMCYLTEQGHKVHGVEIVEKAIIEFKEENPAYWTHSTASEFEKFSSSEIDLYLGDFHRFSKLDMNYESIFDRASMIALPPEMRKVHAKELSTLTKKSGNILLITLEYPQEKVAGPPFSVPKYEVENLFEHEFHIEEIAHESTKNIGSKFINAGINKVEQRVYWLTKK